MEITDAQLATIKLALDDAAYYRLGSEAADDSEIEDDYDREQFTAYRALLAELERKD